MPAAEKTEGRRDDPPALRAALAMLRAGFRPVPIKPGKKAPIGEGWGLRRHTEESLRSEWARTPLAGLGALLGDLGDGTGLIDLEVDDEERAAPVLARLFPAGMPDTLRFRANKGMHYFLRYSARLAVYGQTIIKGEVGDDGKVRGNPFYLGVEFRIGTIDPKVPVQEQSVIPPTPRADGEPRQWIGPGGTLLLPEAAFADPAHVLPIPDSVFADLDWYAHGAAEGDGDPGEPSWDKEAVKAAILPHAVALAKEWGLRITATRPTAKGFLACRAIDRADADPSAGFNATTGVYTDRKHGAGLSIFQLALALRIFPDFPTAVDTLGRRFNVPPAGRRGRESVDAVDSVKWESNLEPPPEWESPVRSEAFLVPDFPLDVLPGPLADLCREGAESLHCPPDYFACAAIGLAGGTIGRSVNLAATSTWKVAPNLYVAVVGSPGSKKSPALGIMARPFWAIDREMRDAYRDELADFKRRQAEDIDAGTPPIRGHLVLDDATREAFALALANNPRGLLLVKDELTGWVAALNAYRQGKGDDKQFWMSLNTGATVKVNRKGNQEDLLIPHACASVVGCMTPGTLPMIRDSRADDGWLDRILFCYPEPVLTPRLWGRPEIREDSLADWDRAIRRLWGRKMVLDPETGQLRPYFVRLTDRAVPVWAEWYNAHNAEQSDPDFPRYLVGPWSKLEGFALRLALILAQLRLAYDFADDGPPRDVDPLDVIDATRLADYFKAHFRRARADLVRGSDELDPDAESVLRWIRRSHLAHFTGRDIIRHFPRFNDRDRSAVLATLMAHRYIRPRPEVPRPPGTPGRKPSPTYDVNPFSFDGFDRIDKTPPREPGEDG
jgi:hypothetical protein